MTNRRLPPLNALRAFEAAARHGSFTGAARELSVTQGAISRHVIQLEKWLGTAMCARTRRGIETTADGAAFAAVLANAFDQIDQQTERVMARRHERTLLRLKLPPTFAIRWLVPRLARFHALNRHIDVQITTSHQAVDFRRESIDVCIHSGAEPLPGARCHRLFGEIILPVCSPGLFSRFPELREPSDLARHVLLSSMHREQDWPIWLAAAGLRGVDGNSGLRFENSALAYQAAIDELGVVMAQRAFVADDLQARRLVAPLACRVRTGNAYYLARPATEPPSANVAAFEQWIRAEADSLEQTDTAELLSPEFSNAP
ncbi:MAG: transcriptional regulator GcvA [Hyphomicrobiaceae bacterium]